MHKKIIINESMHRQEGKKEQCMYPLFIWGFILCDRIMAKAYAVITGTHAWLDVPPMDRSYAISSMVGTRVVVHHSFTLASGQTLTGRDYK